MTALGLRKSNNGGGNQGLGKKDVRVGNQVYLLRVREVLLQVQRSI